MATIGSVFPPGGVVQDELHQFRNDVHDCLSARADALFELLDGLCCPIPVGGVAHVTLAGCARRGHDSAYDALARGCIDTGMLRDVLMAYRPAGWVADFAVDASTWVRNDAECSPERGFYYHPSRHSAGAPIVAGWSFPWIAGLCPSPDSWTAPVDAHRLRVADNVKTVAVARVRAVLTRLPPGAAGALSPRCDLYGYPGTRISTSLVRSPRRPSTINASIWRRIRYPNDTITTPSLPARRRPTSHRTARQTP